MKHLEEIAFDPKVCRKQLQELKVLLRSQSVLGERSEILPFFKARPHLCAFLGSYAHDVTPADRIAFEFSIYGDFTADVVVGNSRSGTYCLIELEDASRDSIFRRVPSRATTEWSKRYEHGFSQLVDWFYALSDLRNTDRFARDFGRGHCRFHGFLILGRSAFLSDEDRNRLRWRTEKVLVDSHPIHCLTLDQVHGDLSWRLKHYSRESKRG